MQGLKGPPAASFLSRRSSRLVRKVSVRAFPEELVAHYAGANLIICDAQYGDDEYTRKVGWGHARATTAVDLAIRAGVQQLALYHHDPLQVDEEVEAKVKLCAARAKQLGSSVQVFAAREGVELKYG